VFLGLGCPKQEVFAYEHRESVKGVQICVGAAFDFLSGEKRMAPKWMQDRGLEWLFRLSTEPRRLHRRYLRANSIFIWLVVREVWRRRT
jgi:exopolysaccharide biosynthesis WecB/TagA/CpsF family protein